MVIVVSSFIDVWKKFYEKEKNNVYMAQNKQYFVLPSRYGVNLKQNRRTVIQIMRTNHGAVYYLFIYSCI